MVDFREELCIQQTGENDFAYCWTKTDAAVNELQDYDYEQSCTYEEVMNAVCKHGFDADKVHNHFLNNPCDSMVLTDEY